KSAVGAINRPLQLFHTPSRSALLENAVVQVSLNPRRLLYLLDMRETMLAHLASLVHSRGDACPRPTQKDPVAANHRAPLNYRRKSSGLLLGGHIKATVWHSEIG